MNSLWAKTKITLEMIKWEHSIFALPFLIILQTPQTSPDTLSKSLRELRPWTRTLSVFSDAEMIPDMIHALGG